MHFYANLMSSTVSVALPSLEGESRDSLSGKVAALQSGKLKIYPMSGVNSPCRQVSS